MKNPISIGNWEKLGECAGSIRDAVFIQEQGISEDLEHDDRDSTADHVVLFCNEMPIATGRIEAKGKIGRVAVLSKHRRKGFGKMIMDALESIAYKKGISTVFVHAQTTVIPFYRQLGYSVHGEETIEANIPHQYMEKFLKP